MKKIISVLMGFMLILSTTSAWLLNGAFRDTNPNSGDIIDEMFSTDSYTFHRNNNSCTLNSGSIQVQFINAGTDFATLGHLQTDNRIYVLGQGTHDLAGTKYIRGNCIAIVGSHKTGEPLPTIQAWGVLPQVLSLYGSNKNTVIDGIKIDGAGSYAAIKIEASGWPSSNNTIYNTELTNNDYAFYMYGANSTNNASYNAIINNNIAWNTNGIAIIANETGSVFNNIFSGNTIEGNDVGITIVGNPDNNTISGNTLIGNGTGVEGAGTGNDINGNVYSGNTVAGEIWTNATGNNFPSDHLTDEQQCNNFGGCYCTPQADAVIADTTRCTDTTKTIRTIEGSAYDCNDHDGCTCSFDSSNYAYGSTSVSCTDGTPTTLSNDQQCTDPDDCSCNGAELAMRAYCRIASSGGGGGWGSSSSRDNCPDWDYSPNYYDNICWEKPIDGEISLSGVVNNDIFEWYNSIDKVQLLAGEYKALVDAGDTTLRHEEFFTILYKYTKLKNLSSSKLKVIISVLIDIFADMSEKQLTKFGFDKTLLLQELERLIL